MASQTRIPELRSASEIPLRDAPFPAALGTLSGRISLSGPRPHAPGGFSAKGYAGEVVTFGITAFREGHDLIGVHLRLTSPTGIETLHRLAATSGDSDRWWTDVALEATGQWQFRFEGFGDLWATWAHAAEVKAAASVDLEVMAASAKLLLARGRKGLSGSSTPSKKMLAALAQLDDPSLVGVVAADQDLSKLFSERPVYDLHSHTTQHTLTVERRRAGVGAWYEFFPRSEGAKRLKDGTIKSGNFRTAAKRLPAVSEMGFDVLYLPPIHPIGRINRKGPNNTLVATTADPGSPWAIGAAEGGHDTVHPDLGTLKDFRAFVAAAKKVGMEVALDLALQAAPDHPWVTEHPEWFTTLPDGTIAYAENPPKKYQDIYPLNFDNDFDGLSAEILRVVRHWIDQGISIFRVDNPHTKPLQFWEWLIDAVRSENPEVVFLAEAFTRPEPMKALAAAGFQQSYTYFTWRNTKSELEEFLTSVTDDTADYLRPNLFINTPDILTEYLQFGGRAAYRIRAAIAATAAPTYGVYAGYELFENVARPGSEENIDNEKYEYKVRDFALAEARGDSLAPYLRTLNDIRRAHPALGQLRNLTLQWSEDDAVLAYVKHLSGDFTADGTDDTIIVVANVDPHSVRETTVHLDTTIWGVPPGEPFEVEDLISGSRWTWRDHNYVRLDAFAEPVHILAVVR